MKIYIKTRENREQFLSMTSLYPEEFDLLVPLFSQGWYKYNRRCTLEGKIRKIKNRSPEKDTKTLPNVEDKLFFLLVYLKQHPLQQFQAVTFDLSQAKVSQWVKILKSILEQTLVKLGCVPCRDGSVLKEFINQIPNVKVITQDVVEQSAARSVDDQAQEAQYSGKKKDIPTKTR